MRHGGEVCRLLVVVVPTQTQKRLILKKGTTTTGLTTEDSGFVGFY